MLDPAFLGAQSKSVTLEPLPKPKLPPADSALTAISGAFVNRIASWATVPT